MERGWKTSASKLLLRKYPDQIIEAVKKLQWQAQTANGLPTVIVERRGAEIVRVLYRGATERLGIGPRLRSLVAYLVIHRRTEHSTEMLASVLDISPQSLKEYLLRLRLAFNRIRPKLGILLRGEDVFRTKRLPGGFVHGLKANAEIEDSDEFFLPEEDSTETAARLHCHLCRRGVQRAEIAWSHFGWMCRNCAEELSEIGEV